MTRRILCRVAFFACLVLTLWQFVSAQPKPQSSSEPFATKVERFNNYAKDFIAFARAQQHDPVEYEISTDLFRIADRAADHLDFTKLLLEVYHSTSCAPDRPYIRAMVKLQLSYYARKMDNGVDVVNIDLPHTGISAVATTGVRLRDELRDAKTMLDSLQSSLE